MELFSARFEDTVFIKESSDLQDQYDALVKLNDEYPNNENILEELVIVKKGMYSPLRQVEAQREVVRKRSMKNLSLFDKLRENLFDTKENYYDYRRVLVVAANPETILNTSKAPKEIKNKVIRADALIRKNRK